MMHGIKRRLAPVDLRALGIAVSGILACGFLCAWAICEALA